MERFATCFCEVEDPRGANAVHDLTEILFIALLATLCGATSCCDMALFGRIKQGLLRQVLELKHGLPSHDTFSRVFRMLDPEGFEAAFQRFMSAFAAQMRLDREQGVVAIDGKALRCAYERGQSHMPKLMVTAWGTQTRMALGNVLAEEGGEAAAEGEEQAACHARILDQPRRRGCSQSRFHAQPDGGGSAPQADWRSSDGPEGRPPAGDRRAECPGRSAPSAASGRRRAASA